MITPEEYQYRRKQAAEHAVDALSKAINGSTGYHEVATALANDHPTLLGQMAKAMGVGVMRRALYDPDWKPFDKPVGSGLCNQERRSFRWGSEGVLAVVPDHAYHDGRLDCITVIGAELMARQSYI